MKLSNYLLQLIDCLDDRSIRVSGIDKEFRAMWKVLKNKKRVLQNFNLSKNSMGNYLKHPRFIPISVVYRVAEEYCRQQSKDFQVIWNGIFKRVQYFKSECSKSKPVELPKKLDGDLAYLVGALRDGCLATFRGNKNHFGVIFTQESCPEWFEQTIIPMFERLFEFKPALRYEIQIYNKPIFKFFQNVFEHPPGDQDAWGTPTIIKHANRKIQLKYIQGFFDAEGVCSMKGHKLGRLGFVQNNVESLQFIKNILEHERIKCGSILKSRNTNVFSICSSVSIKRFITRIGTQHPERRAKLAQFRS